MIAPGPDSPLRPVLTAYYRTIATVTTNTGPEAYLRCLRAALAQAGARVNGGGAAFDLIVDGRIGVAWCVGRDQPDAAVRARVVEALAAPGAPEVALILVAPPHTRVVRINRGRPDAPPTICASYQTSEVET